MTLIACSLIDRILTIEPPDKPSAVLQAMHRGLKQMLGQNSADAGTNDGVEAGVCFLPDDGSQAIFAGARFSIWVREGETTREVRGDKAGLADRKLADDASFTDMVIDLTEETMLYMTTDGLIDQIGGERQRSFGKRRFLEVLNGTSNQDLKGQGAALEKALSEYQGDQVRRDDVTVLGLRPRAPTRGT